ncbi:unnamed protein product [Pleuronectes platessa]|uniref:Uncharacterized protein n=1 Tax=Pleuronectes platessa TaxID=8262 RepID=A0A9N7ZBA4_PLEPL|nr:unnamed protein product [Pleuronectes platessa]
MSSFSSFNTERCGKRSKQNEEVFVVKERRLSAGVLHVRRAVTEEDEEVQHGEKLKGVGEREGAAFDVFVFYVDRSSSSSPPPAVYLHSTTCNSHQCVNMLTVTRDHTPTPSVR